MSTYDEHKKANFTTCLDANSLYGLAMSRKLPYSRLKWNTTITEEDIRNYDEGSDQGDILKVDLEYPKELHD